MCGRFGFVDCQGGFPVGETVASSFLNFQMRGEAVVVNIHNKSEGNVVSE
jgi:hypothetical protein